MSRNRLRRWVIALVFAAAATARPAAANDDPWLIVAGTNAGPITPTASEADLAAIFGAGNVRPGEVEIGEGVREPGTIIFPDDPERRIEILWHDTAARRRPARLQITGHRTLWHFAQAISLGTSLKQLETLNGNPFYLTGFGWDYGGTVLSWEGGALATALGGGYALLRLTPDYATPGEGELSDRVSGDRDFRSDDPVMQAIDPTVDQIILEF